MICLKDPKKDLSERSQRGCDAVHVLDLTTRWLYNLNLERDSTTHHTEDNALYLNLRMVPRITTVHMSK